MAVIGVKSITGITSITNAAGGADVLTFHSNNTTERLRIDSTGKATFSGDVQIDGDELFIADSIKHVGDTDTLISFPSNDTINFRTAGNERLRITSTGAVGIGTNNPISGAAGARLAVHLDDNTSYAGGTARGNGIIVYNATAGGHSSLELAQRNSANTYGTVILNAVNPADGNNYGADFTIQTRATGSGNYGERLRITSSGYVGINDTSGNARLIVKGNSDTSDADCQIRIYDTDSTSGSQVPSLSFWGPSTEIGRIRGTDTQGMRFYTHDGSSLGERLRIDSSGRIGIDYTPGSGDGPFNVDISGSNNIFHLGHGTNNDNYYTTGASGTQYFRTPSANQLVIKSNGNIGVGIDAPLHNLHIKPPTASETILKIESESGYDARLKLDTSNGGGAEARIDFEEDASIRGFISYTNNSGGTTDDMVFGTATTERLRITSGGQLIQTTTHTSGNSAHQNTNWYGDDANEYAIEIRDFNEMYAEKTHNSNSYNSIIYKREKMTHNCDIEFMLAGGSDQAGSGYYHLGMSICGDGSDTASNWDRLVFRCHGGTASNNQIRIDKAGGGSGFSYVTGSIPQFFDGNDRHIQIKIRGRRYSVYSDGVEIVTRYSNADNPRQNGFFGFIIYEASSVNPWIKIRDFKIQNYSLNTSLPSWEVIKSVPASTNNSYHYTVTDLNNPRTVEIRFWRLRHSGANGRMLMRLGPSSGYITSGYYDIGTWRSHSNSGATITRGHNQGQWWPLNYDFNDATNYYSGSITLKRISNSGRNTRIIYESTVIVDYDSNNTQYFINNSGQMTFANSNAWDRLTFYNESSSAVLNYGELEILAQH